MSTFVGIGAQKAATTWLFQMLDLHPQIEFPLGKEAHYWNRPDRVASREFQWLDAFSDDDGTKAIGEITPAYATLAADVVAAIAERCPELRVFISLRNPIERAWSSALMALERAEMRLDEASDAWFLDHLRSQGSRARGDYFAALRTWRRAFGDDALAVVLYDDLCTDPRSVLRELALHLGVSPAPFDTLGEDALGERVFAGPGVPLRPTLVAPLEELYGDAIDALGHELDRDLSAWRSPVKTTNESA